MHECHGRLNWWAKQSTLLTGKNESGRTTRELRRRHQIPAYGKGAGSITEGKPQDGDRLPEACVRSGTKRAKKSPSSKKQRAWADRPCPCFGNGVVPTGQ